MNIKTSLKSFLFLLNSVIPIEYLNLVLKFVKFILNLKKDLLQLLFLSLCFLDGAVHAFNLLVKLSSSCDFFQHFKEASFTLIDEFLNFTLGYHLKLRWAWERKVPALKKVEKIFLADALAIDIELFSVSLAIVGFSDSKLTCPERNATLGVVQGDLNPVGMCFLCLVLDSISGPQGSKCHCSLLCACGGSLFMLAGRSLLSNIVKHATFLLFCCTSKLIWEDVEDGC